MKQFIVIAVLFCSIRVRAQTDSRYKPKIEGKSLLYFLRNAFHEAYEDSLREIGISATVYVRFQIANNGNVVNIESSPSTDIRLVRFFKRVLEKTNGYWNKEGAIPPDEYLILPIEYHVQKNGQTEEVKASQWDLLKFFNSDNGMVYRKVVFLEKLEYVSPFDDSGNGWEKARLKTNL